MFQVPRLHGILQARSLVQPTPSTQGSTLAPSYKATLAPLPFWDCLMKTMLAFLLLGFFSLSCNIQNLFHNKAGSEVSS